MLNHKIFGAGPPLLVLHGLFGMLDNWKTLARRWAEDHTVILADLPNHGRSPHYPEMNYPFIAERVEELLAELRIHQTAVLGHSLGGKAAMQLALHNPDLVEKLIVVDMAPRAYRRGHDDVFAALHSLNPAELTDRKQAADLLGDHITDPGIQLFLLKNLTRTSDAFAWRMNLPVLTERYAERIRAIGEDAEPYPHPALFLRGAKSGYVREDDWPLIQSLFPEARLATVANAGHWVHAEAPDVTYAEVRDFLAR